MSRKQSIKEEIARAESNFERAQSEAAQPTDYSDIVLQEQVDNALPEELVERPVLTPVEIRPAASQTAAQRPLDADQEIVAPEGDTTAPERDQDGSDTVPADIEELYRDPGAWDPENDPVTGELGARYARAVADNHKVRAREGLGEFPAGALVQALRAGGTRALRNMVEAIERQNAELFVHLPEGMTSADVRSLSGIVEMVPSAPVKLTAGQQIDNAVSGASSVDDFLARLSTVPGAVAGGGQLYGPDGSVTSGPPVHP